MVYIITQTKGHLADAAKAMWEATCQNQDEATAKALMVEHFPEYDPSLPHSYNPASLPGFWNEDGTVYCWWRFNAPSRISQKIELPEKLLDKIYDWCYSNGHMYDDRAERWIVSELKKRFPDCEWDIYYEY